MSPFNVLDTMLANLSNFVAVSSDLDDIVANYLRSNAELSFLLLQELHSSDIPNKLQLWECAVVDKIHGWSSFTADGGTEHMCPTLLALSLLSPAIASCPSTSPALASLFAGVVSSPSFLSQLSPPPSERPSSSRSLEPLLLSLAAVPVRAFLPSARASVPVANVLLSTLDALLPVISIANPNALTPFHAVHATLQSLLPPSAAASLSPNPYRPLTTLNSQGVSTTLKDVTALHRALGDRLFEQALASWTAGASAPIPGGAPPPPSEGSPFASVRACALKAFRSYEAALLLISDDGQLLPKEVARGERDARGNVQDAVDRAGLPLSVADMMSSKSDGGRLGVGKTAIALIDEQLGVRSELYRKLVLERAYRPPRFAAPPPSTPSDGVDMSVDAPASSSKNLRQASRFPSDLDMAAHCAKRCAALWLLVNPRLNAKDGAGRRAWAEPPPPPPAKGGGIKEVGPEDTTDPDAMSIVDRPLLPSSNLEQQQQAGGTSGAEVCRQPAYLTVPFDGGSLLPPGKIGDVLRALVTASVESGNSPAYVKIKGGAQQSGGYENFEVRDEQDQLLMETSFGPGGGESSRSRQQQGGREAPISAAALRTEAAHEVAVYMRLLEGLFYEGPAAYRALLTNLPAAPAPPLIVPRDGRQMPRGSGHSAAAAGGAGDASPPLEGSRSLLLEDGNSFLLDLASYVVGPLRAVSDLYEAYDVIAIKTLAAARGVASDGAFFMAAVGESPDDVAIRTVTDAFRCDLFLGSGRVRGAVDQEGGYVHFNHGEVLDPQGLVKEQREKRMAEIESRAAQLTALVMKADTELLMKKEYAKEIIEVMKNANSTPAAGGGGGTGGGAGAGGPVGRRK